VKLRYWRYDLTLAHRWSIASGLKPDGSGGTAAHEVVFVELTDREGVVGLGEAAPSERYRENADSVTTFLQHVDAKRLLFSDLTGSTEYLEGLRPSNSAAKCALNLALHDGAAKLAGRPVFDMLGLGFTEGKHVTSFSIGIDSPEMVRRKVLEAEVFPILKLKIGSPRDRENLAALREVAPQKTVRVDANEAWKTKEEALGHIEWLAAQGGIQFVEQPMPAGVDSRDVAWLKERSPLPIMADESYLSAKDLGRCAGNYHAVNVKLVKTGGITGGIEALKAARRAELKTMLGCMIESSLLITAAAHLAELTDYLDIDGNLLITNDPYQGVASEKGVLSFAKAPERTGLRVSAI
jgi:L-alanine-DL-glutamate epimerase-like enolase superfamily enzyme